MIRCTNNGQLPEFKKGLPCTVRFPQNLENLICIEIWQKFLYYLTEEKDPQIVAISISSIEILVLKLGPAFIDHNLADLCDRIIVLLEGQGICQKAESDEEEGGDDETIAKIFEALTDLIPALAKVLQGGFEL